MINNMLPIRTDPGELVLKEGEYGDCMYFVEEGLY